MHKTYTNVGREESGREIFEFIVMNAMDVIRGSFVQKIDEGRSIKISENIEVMEAFNEEMESESKKALMMKLKEIVEHPFGIIKRNLGYTYFLVRCLEMVKSEFSLICFTYNFKRVLNILGVEGFLKEIERQKLLRLT